MSNNRREGKFITYLPFTFWIISLYNSNTLFIFANKLV
nr:MAG TPA: hypothetical protein [Crassvirales sp.]